MPFTCFVFVFISSVGPATKCDHPTTHPPMAMDFLLSPNLKLSMMLQINMDFQCGHCTTLFINATFPRIPPLRWYYTFRLYPKACDESILSVRQSDSQPDRQPVCK